jgi:hypothetical protein
MLLMLAAILPTRKLVCASAIFNDIGKVQDAGEKKFGSCLANIIRILQACVDQGTLNCALQKPLCHLFEIYC